MPSSDNKTASVAGPALIPTGDYARKPAIPLTRPVTVVGSRNNCRIHLISSTVSKAHCLLVLTDTGCYVADLASRTKTIVNGKPVQEHDLRDGDTLTIGRFTFRYKAGRTRPAGRFPAAASASLQVTGAPIPLPIERRVLLVGRRRSADVPLLEESVSTAHAVVFERDGKRFIRDLGSRTGTFVNRRKVHQEELNTGDKVKIGETSIVYVVDDVTVPMPSPIDDALGLSAGAATDELDLSTAADDRSATDHGGIDRQAAEQSAAGHSGLALEPVSELDRDPAALPEIDFEPEPAPPSRGRPASPIVDRSPAPPADTPAAGTPAADTPAPLKGQAAAPVIDEHAVDHDLIDLDVDADPPAAVPATGAMDLELDPPASSADTAIAIASETESEPDPEIALEIAAEIDPDDLPTETRIDAEAPADALLDAARATPAESAAAATADFAIDAGAADLPSTEPSSAVPVEPEVETSAEDLTPRRGWRPADGIDSLPEPESLVDHEPEPQTASGALPAESSSDESATDESAAADAIVVADAPDQPEPQTGAIVEARTPAAALPTAAPEPRVIEPAPIDDAPAAEVESINETPVDEHAPADLETDAIESTPLETAPIEAAPLEAAPIEAGPIKPVVGAESDERESDAPAISEPEPAEPATAEAEIDLATLQQSAGRADETTADDDSDHDLDEPFTAAGTAFDSAPTDPVAVDPVVLEPTDPDPESALPTAIDDAPTPIVEADAPAMTDSVFAHQLEAFTEDQSTGAVIPGDVADHNAQQLASAEPPTPADTISPNDDLPPFALDDLAAPEDKARIVADAPATTDIDSPDFDATGLASAAPVSARPTASEPPPGAVATNGPVDDASHRATADAPSNALDPWGSDRDAFLGGGPLSLTGGNLLADDKPADPHANDTRIVDAFGVTPPPATDPAPTRKQRGSQRRRRSLRNDPPLGESGIDQAPAGNSRKTPPPLVDPLSPNTPPITDVFAQPSPFAVDAAPEAPGAAAPDALLDRPLQNVAPVADASTRRPGRPGGARPQFADRSLPDQMPPRRRAPLMPDLDEQAAAERLHHERRRKLRTASALFVVMLALIGGIAWGIKTYMPVTADVEVAVRFTNLDAMASQRARDEFMRSQRELLGSAAVRQTAINTLASTATPELQVPAGLLVDPVAYDRVASAATWQQRSDSTALLIRLQSTDYKQDRHRLRAIAQSLVQANEYRIADERRLRADVERLTRELESARAEQTELRQLIETEQSLGDSRPRYQAQLAKIDTDLEQLENARIAHARQVSQIESELAELRTNMPQITGDDPNAASEVASDLELRQMQQQLTDVTKSLEALRGAGRDLADEARRAYDASMEQFQQDITAVRGTLDASPELQAYVESTQGLLEITRRLSEAVLHRQQQSHDRLQSMRQWLEESMRSRRVEMWQKDPELQRLNEQHAFAQRQLNVASSNNLPDEANDARLQIQVLEQKIVERQNQIGNDELALKLVLDLQEMIDGTARTMAEDRASGEKMIEEQTQRLQRAAVEKLPSEQRELAAKLEQRLQQISSARRQLASTISGEQATADEQIQKLLQQQTDLTARLEARKKGLADAAAQRLTRQQQQARQDRITAKESELTASRTQLAETQDKLNVLYRDQRSTMRKIAESSLAGDRVASATTKLQQLQQTMQTWESTLNQRKSELAAAVVPREVSDLDINTRGEGEDNRLLYFAVAGGLVFLTFSFLIGATIRSALHDVPAPYLPARHIPLAEPLEAPHHDAAREPADDLDPTDDPASPPDRNPAHAG